MAPYPIIVANRHRYFSQGLRCIFEERPNLENTGKAAEGFVFLNAVRFSAAGPLIQEALFLGKAAGPAIPRSIKVYAATPDGVFSVGGGMSPNVCEPVPSVARRIASDLYFPAHTVLSCPNTG